LIIFSKFLDLFLEIPLSFLMVIVSLLIE
jgi:hypothetical protein